MKRIYLLLACGILLCGCTKDQSNQSIVANSSTRLPDDYGMIIDPVSRDDKEFDNYYEYWDHFEGDAVVPVNFIHYEQIASLGDFQKYESFNGINPDGTAQYKYTLKDADERVIYLNIFKGTFTNYYDDVEEIEPGNLSVIPSWTPNGHETYRVFIVDNIRYKYNKKGILVDIYLEIEGFDYGISLDVETRFDFVIGDPEGTFIERMLCLESAPAAVEEFAQMISTPYTPEDEVVS